MFDVNLLKELDASTAPAKQIGTGTSSIRELCSLWGQVLAVQWNSHYFFSLCLSS